jgi:hypothetical protein
MQRNWDVDKFKSLAQEIERRKTSDVGLVRWPFDD